MEFLKDIFFAVMVTAIKDEMNNLMTKIATLIIDKALYYVPAQSQERYAEEWKAHLSECPSGIRKLCHSAGCFFAAIRMDQTIPFWAGIFVASIFMFFISPLTRQISKFCLAEAKVYLSLSKLFRRIRAYKLSHRLRRIGLSLAHTSFMIFNLHYACRLFQWNPQRCPAGASVRDYHLYFKMHALFEIASRLHLVSQRRYSTQIILTLFGKSTAVAEKLPLPEYLREVSKSGIFRNKRSRIKWYRQTTRVRTQLN